MLETCAEWSRAMSFISRHKLAFKYQNGRALVAKVLDRPRRDVAVGVGTNLYEAVLDLQEKTGVSWGGSFESRS